MFDQIAKKGSYTEKDAAHIIAQLLGAVAYLHTKGIVHRDLKPENLLFRDKSENADILVMYPFCFFRFEQKQSKCEQLITNSGFHIYFSSFFPPHFY